MPSELYLVRLIHQRTRKAFPGERLWTAQQVGQRCDRPVSPHPEPRGMRRLHSTLRRRPKRNSLEVHISHLRKKLETGRLLIRTVRGTGYLFVEAEEQ